MPLSAKEVFLFLGAVGPIDVVGYRHEPERPTKNSILGRLSRHIRPAGIGCLAVRLSRFEPARVPDTFAPLGHLQDAAE
jgi:hypothetical protein